MKMFAHKEIDATFVNSLAPWIPQYILGDLFICKSYWKHYCHKFIETRLLDFI